MTKKHKKPESKKSMSDAAYIDMVVSTNVYADLHRILQDRLDCDFNTPAAADAFDPTEVTRRAAYALLSDVADDVAIRWRDFTPNPEAVAVLDLPPVEARQVMIGSLKESLKEEAADIEAGVRTDVIEAYEERRKAGCDLTPEQLAEAVDKGITKGRQVIADMFEWLEQDTPSMNYPDAAAERAKAIQTCWEITCRHVKARVPEESEPPADLKELYRLAYLDTAQNALYEAFNFMAYGVRDPDSQPHEAPCLFAGSIMTELGVPQPYIDPGPDAQEVAMMEEGCTSPPTPMNGEVAESPQAVQMRELMMVFNAIGEDLLIGELAKGVKKSFKRMAKLAFAPDEPEEDMSYVHLVAPAEGKPKLDLKVSKKTKAKAADDADGMIRDIIADMVVEMKTQDGWTLDRSTLKTTDDKMAISPPAKFTVMPHTATLQ